MDPIGRGIARRGPGVPWTNGIVPYEISSVFIDMLNTSYDYASVMHYPPNAFSVNNRPTIEPLQPNVTIGQRFNLSSIDIQEVRILYNCSATGVTLPQITITTTSN
ncbi:unnamed protein product [Rotaria sp. Silwood2]|nr:unnamed protein product [Rotaria sp. Silwood2]CAF2947308.1 unnamed protein product [Rotaria sp. Silwood2]CAF3216582.1 unnamed protein product [Rotaria sp. Silwood2]